MFAPRNSEDIDSSYCASFINCLRQDENLNKGGIPSPFVLLKDLYRIIASEWIVVNTCWEREWNTIEWRLEREEPRLKNLDRYLKSLFISRRRITLYETLVQDQLSACACMVGSSGTSRLLLMNPRPWQIWSTLSKRISNSSLIFSREMRSASQGT